MSSKFYILQRKISEDIKEVPEEEKINVRYHIVGGEVETFEFE